MSEIGTFEFAAALWRHDGADAWYFVSLPEDVSDEVAELTAGPRRGFGAVKVRVTVGRTTWSTSVFPDAERHTHLLPMKRDVRVKEGIEAGDEVGVRLELLDL